MKWIKFVFVGFIFGVILSKGEIISWYRIYEMFWFESFHMYGVIGSAVVIGILGVQLIKRYDTKSIEGQVIEILPKKKSIYRYLIGGTIFGLGWAMTGACPGPMFILLGKGIYAIFIVIIGAVFGTFMYGILSKYLPH
jgi:uncharacterized membrane protein YedE/YeeE